MTEHEVRANQPDDEPSDLEPIEYTADPDDPDLNPDVERASEIDDDTGSVPRIDVAADAAGAGTSAGDSTTEVEGDQPSSEPAAGDSSLGALASDEGATAEPAVESELAVALVERDEFKALAQRVQADFDNYRKRATAQALAEADRAAGRVVEALLPVLDAAEAAYVQHPDEVGPLLNAMLGELRKHGLETLDLEGKPFDPEVAESVAHEPGDGGDLVVADVLRSGYRWKGRTLRPAMVRTKD